MNRGTVSNTTLRTTAILIKCGTLTDGMLKFVPSSEAWVNCKRARNNRFCFIKVGIGLRLRLRLRQMRPQCLWALCWLVSHFYSLRCRLLRPYRVSVYLRPDYKVWPEVSIIVLLSSRLTARTVHCGTYAMAVVTPAKTLNNWGVREVSSFSQARTYHRHVLILDLQGNQTPCESWE